MTLEVQRDNLGAAREGWNDAEEKVRELREENERIWTAFLGECHLTKCTREKEIKADTAQKMRERFKERIKGIHLDEQETSAIIDQIADEISGDGLLAWRPRINE